MSKFFKALEQAKRDRALRTEPAAAPAARTDEPNEANQPTDSAASEPHWSRLAVASQPPPQAGDATPLEAYGTEELDEHLVSLVAPAAFEAEQYRALRHTIEHLHRAAGLKVIAVSSPGMGDGKTVTSINLAGSLAQAPEARVLLIDLDLRRPAIARLLSLGHSGGGVVDAILDPHLPLDAVVEPRPPFNLFVICGGQTPPSPYEVLKSSRLGELIDAARAQYDFIVIDTPPLTPVQDCRVIGRWVDGFLLVVAANRTPQRQLEEALTTLDQTKILGIVFNQDDRSSRRHYRGYYSGYHSTGSSPSDGHSGGGLKHAVTKISESLRRRGYHRRVPDAGRRRS